MDGGGETQRCDGVGKRRWERGDQGETMLNKLWCSDQHFVNNIRLEAEAQRKLASCVALTSANWHRRGSDGVNKGLVPVIDFTGLFVVFATLFSCLPYLFLSLSHNIDPLLPKERQTSKYKE
ncbi:hypothetical protein E2C01_090586 [Portunus trituberculatus]|uniref:Uncharacterized protein n=1 Tax=Portunus trituberculatus TaxID=210409 RepID=A0A5B7JQR8_PORTR|nr:hypothetical protein [Portunus trituberculatus]